MSFFPTSEIYDSGVDNCLNPKCYVMWPSHLSTHMQLEYLVSFKLAPEARSKIIIDYLDAYYVIQR